MAAMQMGNGQRVYTLNPLMSHTLGHSRPVVRQYKICLLVPGKHSTSSMEQHQIYVSIPFCCTGITPFLSLAGGQQTE